MRIVYSDPKPTSSSLSYRKGEIATPVTWNLSNVNAQRFYHQVAQLSKSFSDFFKYFINPTCVVCSFDLTVQPILHLHCLQSVSKADSSHHTSEAKRSKANPLFDFSINKLLLSSKPSRKIKDAHRVLTQSKFINYSQKPFRHINIKAHKVKQVHWSRAVCSALLFEKAFLFKE